MTIRRVAEERNDACLPEPPEPGVVAEHLRAGSGDEILSVKTAGPGRTEESGLSTSVVVL